MLKSSFFNRIVGMWNVLPLKVRQASNISNFKKGEGTSCYQDMTKPSYIILVLMILIHFLIF